MSRLGADPDALRDLGTRLRLAARSMDDVAAGLDRRVRAAGWHGEDADRFGSDWQRAHRPSLLRVAEQLRDTSRHLDRQAEDQVRASADISPAAWSYAPPATRSGATAARPTVPVPERAPREELLLRAGTEVTASSLLLGLRKDLSVRRLGHRRTLLTTIETDRAGAVATFGASAGLHAGGSGTGAGGGGGGRDHLLSTQARASATVAQITRQQYLVDDDQVGSTVARLGAEVAAGSAADSLRHAPVIGSAVAAAEPAIALWGWVADRATDRIGASLAPDLGLSLAPEPDRVETLAEVAVSGSLSGALASTLGLDAGSEVSGSIRVGEARIGDELQSRILEADGSVAATLQGTLLDRLGIDVPGRRSIDATLRIEAPLHPTDGVDLIVTSTTSNGTTLHHTTSNVALVGHATAATLDLDSALRQLTAGDAVGAVRTVSVVDLTADAVSTRETVLRVSDRALGADASLGQGLGLGLEGGVGVRRLERIG